ncbi:MAG: signal peptidase I [Haloarculaceae archaeon]
MTRASEAPRFRPTARRWLPVVGLAVLVALVVPFLVIAVPQAVGADHSFVILSGSMEPSISPGDVVIVDTSAAVAVGDVVTFDSGSDVPTTHRVVDVADGQYVTKGDANENADSRPVNPDDVLGRVSLTIPLAGYVVLWANSPTGYVALVIAPIGLLLANELYAWAVAPREDDSADERTPSDSTDERTPRPAIRRVDDAAAQRPNAGAARSTPSHETVAVAVVDLKLAILAMAGLVAYAALNVYREFVALGAPDPISVGALTGGVIGLTFAVWVTISARLAARSAEERESSDTAPRPLSMQTDPETIEVER